MSDESPAIPTELLEKLSSLDLSRQEDLDTLFALEAELGEVMGLHTAGGSPSAPSEPEEEPTPAYLAAADPRVDLHAFTELVGNDRHQTVNGQTLLFPACLVGSREKIEWLLQQGLDPNQSDRDGYTPLIYASLPGREADSGILRLLLEHGADPGLESRHGETPLRILAREGNYEAAMLLLPDHEDHPDFPLVHQAAVRGDLEMLGSCLAPDTIEQRSHCQRTPWLSALHANEVPTARFLESQGADTTAVGHTGDTALHLAAEGNAPDAVTHLLSQGFLLDARASFGNTPLHNAVENDAHDTARLLLEAGADVQALTEAGDAPIAFADSTGMLQLLCNHGADPNQADSRGVRPLEHFAECEDLDALCWLLANGADLSALSEDNRSHVRALLTT